MVDVCVIPAAGKGSRWAPVSGYLPKEMLPLIDRPVIEWVINEVASSGCKKVIIVINRSKAVIRDYLSLNKDVKKRAKLHFVYQEKPLGIAHAMLLCKTIVGKNPFGVALPDLPTISRQPVMLQMIKDFKKTGQSAHVTSFCNFPPESLHLYTECLVQRRKDGLLDIIHFCPKSPDLNQSHHPGSRLRMSGRYVFTDKIFPVIEKLLSVSKGAEVKDIHALEGAMNKSQNVYGVEITGHTYDTGNPVNYIRANTAFFKKKLTRRAR